MYMNSRRWLTLIAVLLISAIFLSIHGWRLLEKASGCKSVCSNSLRRFGGALHYQRLEANLSGVHLSQVSYAPAARSFKVSIEKISVTFRFWDLLKNVIKRQPSNRNASRGKSRADSLISLSGYHLDISIERPSLTLLGDWDSRLRNWRRRRSAAGKSNLLKRLATISPAVPFAISGDQVSDTSSTSSITEASSRSWNFELVRRLDISNGAILWEPLDGSAPMLLANEIEGDLNPATLAATTGALKTKFEEQLCGKLLVADNHNFFVRALVDLKKAGSIR
jgi:hypothetical protein